MKDLVIKIVSVVLGVVIAAAAARAVDDEHVPEAVCEALGKDERRVFDLAAVPLSDVVRVVACALDRNMLFQQPALASKTLTFLGPKPLNRREILNAWHAMLLEHKLVEERRGGFYVIRPMR